MDVQVNTNISKEFHDIHIEINVTAPELTEELKRILNNLYQLSSNKEEIVAMKDNEIFLLNISSIIYFYSDEKNNYARTKEGTYRVKEKLYELERTLESKNFIRISNSCIINIRKAISFDVSQIGSLFVKMEDGTKQEVSKRKIKNVMDFLKRRK